MAELGERGSGQGGDFGADSGEEGGGSRVKEKASEVASKAKEKGERLAAEGREKADELVHRAEDRARTRAAEEKGRVADGIRTVAEALRRGGEELPEDRRMYGRVVNAVADRAEELSRYLEEQDVDQMTRDARRFAREHTGVVLSGAFALGLLGARFMKSSGGAARSERWASRGSERTGAYDAGYRTSGGYPSSDGYDRGEGYHAGSGGHADDYGSEFEEEDLGAADEIRHDAEPEHRRHLELLGAVVHPHQSGRELIDRVRGDGRALVLPVATDVLERGT